ncbi:CBS domain-containing protein [Streptomyces hygroscopicus]|uniref:CBS domain-containing protein n=1 Tax=Streptomyces hygroscopicus TaxID=1912 RepID=UPI00223F7257|nr:CBS domain-containing protein [Streptomyces hygroscopicus]MCW7945076.1 CBS domain-containing protein [Streptomyces hygroscopicus]
MHGTPHIVSDVMTQTVAAIGRRATFKEIVRMMQDWRVSALPVLEGEGRVVGVVSEADLLPKEEYRDGDPDLPDAGPGAGAGSGAGADPFFAPTRRRSDRPKAVAVTAEELMTSPALTTHAGATLAQAARTMARAGVKRLPVVDDLGMLQGIVSRSDLLKVFLRDDEDIAQEVRSEVVPYLFPTQVAAVRVVVENGVVTLGGRIGDTSVVPLAARLVRAVEGVVDVRFDLTGTGSAPK